MRRFLLNIFFLTIFSLPLLIVNFQLFAQSPSVGGGTGGTTTSGGNNSTLNNLNDNFTIPNPTRYNSLEDIINALTSLIRPLFILTTAGLILYGAWVRSTAQDNADNIKKSRDIILGSLIGLGIAVFAPTIVDFFGRLIGVQGGLIQN